MKTTILALLIAATPQIRATIHRALRPGDFEIVWTANPSDAAAASAWCSPDLLLLEINQPLPAGQRVIDTLRTANPGAPVVLLTEHKAAYAEVVAGQGNVAVERPSDAAALAESVHRLLRLPLSKQQPEENSPVRASREYREKLERQAATPLATPILYHQWGLNE